jgi:hypothetical protein
MFPPFASVLVALLGIAARSRAHKIRERAVAFATLDRDEMHAARVDEPFVSGDFGAAANRCDRA